MMVDLTKLQAKLVGRKILAVDLTQFTNADRTRGNAVLLTLDDGTMFPVVGPAFIPRASRSLDVRGGRAE